MSVLKFSKSQAQYDQMEFSLDTLVTRQQKTLSTFAYSWFRTQVWDKVEMSTSDDETSEVDQYVCHLLIYFSNKTVGFGRLSELSDSSEGVDSDERDRILPTELEDKSLGQEIEPQLAPPELKLELSQKRMAELYQRNEVRDEIPLTSLH